MYLAPGCYLGEFSAHRPDLILIVPRVGTTKRSRGIVVEGGYHLLAGSDGPASKALEQTHAWRWRGEEGIKRFEMGLLSVGSFGDKIDSRGRVYWKRQVII